MPWAVPATLPPAINRKIPLPSRPRRICQRLRTAPSLRERVEGPSAGHCPRLVVEFESKALGYRYSRMTKLSGAHHSRGAHAYEAGIFVGGLGGVLDLVIGGDVQRVFLSLQNVPAGGRVSQEEQMLDTGPALRAF